MLFLASEGTRVREISREFKRAGIGCEIRVSSRPGIVKVENGFGLIELRVQGPSEAELWINNDGDCHKALMLCIRLGLGFLGSDRTSGE